MRALSPTDEIFLLLERARQPMHVAGLFVLEPAHGDGRAFARALYQRFAQFERPVAPFDERLTLTPLGFCWVKDPHFDLSNHLRLSALPSPGGQAELDAWISNQQEIPLHRERPLWEVHVLEGLSGGRVALYSKVHHALLDGISALRAGVTPFSPDPEARDPAPFWVHPTPAHQERVDHARSPLFEVLEELAIDARDQLASLPTLAHEAGRLVRETGGHLLRSLRGNDDQNPFAGRITGARRFAALSLPLARVEQIARALHHTVNDVVLALCSSALQGYLAERGLCPKRPVIAMVPVSLRRGEAGRGNRLATILTDLALQETQLERRTARVFHSVCEGKQRFASMTNEESVGVTAMTLAPTFLSAMWHGRRDISRFNVVISNVPGPSTPLFLDGARLAGLYPVSIVLDHVALNISLSRYAGALHFGIVACRHAVPDMTPLTRQLERALDALTALCEVRVPAADHALPTAPAGAREADAQAARTQPHRSGQEL